MKTYFGDGFWWMDGDVKRLDLYMERGRGGVMPFFHDKDYMYWPRLEYSDAGPEKVNIFKSGTYETGNLDVGFAANFSEARELIEKVESGEIILPEPVKIREFKSFDVLSPDHIGLLAKIKREEDFEETMRGADKDA